MLAFAYVNPITFPKIIENDRVTIKIQSVTCYNANNWVIKAEIKNKLPNMEVEVDLWDAAVNGVQCFPNFEERVSPHDSYDSEIVIKKLMLDYNDIGDFTDIELNFHIFLPKLYFGTEHYYEKIHIYPLGEDKATRFVRKPKPTDVVILDDDYCTVTVIKHKMVRGECRTYLFFENKCDKSIMFSTHDEKIDGRKVDYIAEQDVLAGKCGWGYFWTLEYMDKMPKKIEFILTAEKELGGGKGKITISETPVTLYLYSRLIMSS